MRKLAFLPVLALTLTACGTLFNGSSQDIQFDSNVKGVEIYVNGMKACKTPCVYPLDRQSSTTVIVAKKPGYPEQQTILKSELSNVAILNLTFWPSWLTDVASGGMWKYSRDGIYIEKEGGRYQPTYQPNYNRGGGYRRANEYYDQYSKYIPNAKEVRRFSLYNYGELKNEAAGNKAGEYIKTLAALSGKNETDLINTINKASGEVNLAHTLTGIE